MSRRVFITRGEDRALGLKPRAIFGGPTCGTLPPILMHGDKVKLPTPQGAEYWHELRGAVHPPEQCDRAVYDAARYGKCWTTAGAL